MDYVIYSACINSDTYINISCNPSVDYTMLKKAYGINCVEVLTPALNISYIHYIMKSINRGGGVLERFMLRSSRRNKNLKSMLIRSAMEKLNLNPVRKTFLVEDEVVLPEEAEIKAVNDLLKGRIVNSSELEDMVNKSGLYLNSNIHDILQVMYLTGRVKVYPSLVLDEPGIRGTCKICESSIDEAPEDDRCPVCGSSAYMDEPMYASPFDETNPSFTSVKFRDYKHFSPAQDRASDELCSFLKSSKNECLLWTVAGEENINITLKAVREVLYRGGRCAVLVSCCGEGQILLNSFAAAFPNRDCKYFSMSGSLADGDIVICSYENIKSFYKAFDLVIINETPGCSMSCIKYYPGTIQRALKDWGKIIYSTSSPDYSLYKRVISNDIFTVMVPIRNHGKPSPEPRVMTYRFLSEEECCIPLEVTEFIIYSIENGTRVRIVVPLQDYVETLRDEFMKCSHIKSEWICSESPSILITTYACRHIYVGEKENVIVFFADDSVVFDEKALLETAGIAGRSPEAHGEVLFVGSKESDEMYNARMMMRFLNKQAWEMGYLR